VQFLSSLLTQRSRGRISIFGSRSGSPLRYVNFVTALLSRLSNTLALRVAALQPLCRSVWNGGL
jgi:hypothetical protein